MKGLNSYLTVRCMTVSRTLRISAEADALFDPLATALHTTPAALLETWIAKAVQEIRSRRGPPLPPELRNRMDGQAAFAEVREFVAAVVEELEHTGALDERVTETCAARIAGNADVYDAWRRACRGIGEIAARQSLGRLVRDLTGRTASGQCRATGPAERVISTFSALR